MSFEWFRWYHGTTSDPKFTAVSRKAKQPKAAIIAVWAAILEYASQAEVRGDLGGLDHEDIAACLDMDDDDVARIIDALGVKGLIGDGKVFSWERRQVRREREDNSRERVRKWRQKKAGNAIVTPGNANEIQVTPPESESESDTEKEQINKSVVSPTRETQKSTTDTPLFFELTPERMAWAQAQGFSDASWVRAQTERFIDVNDGKRIRNPDQAWQRWLEKGRELGIESAPAFRGRQPKTDDFPLTGRPHL